MSVWRQRCQAVIAAVHATLPEDADLKTRRMALKGEGWRAHDGTAWGRKMWGRCVREYLARYGQKGADGLPLFKPTKLDMANAELRHRRVGS